MNSIVWSKYNRNSSIKPVELGIREAQISEQQRCQWRCHDTNPHIHRKMRRTQARRFQLCTRTTYW